MITNHFIVAQRDNAWQVSFKGNITAPFAARADAITAAIKMAGETGQPDVEVIVQDADHRTETLWRGDGLDLTERESAHLADDLERNSDA